jgi:hypothetical protein
LIEKRWDLKPLNNRDRFAESLEHTLDLNQVNSEK